MSASHIPPAILSERLNLSVMAKMTRQAVLVTDRYANILWANDSFERITGYNLGEIRGRNPGSFLQGIETDKHTVARMSAKLAQGESFMEEILNYHKDGQKQWIELEVFPVHNDAGEVVNFVSVQTDISERKLADQRFADNLVRLRKQEHQQQVMTDSLLRLNKAGNLQDIDLNEFVRQVNREAATVMHVDRFSFWRYNPSDHSIVCIHLFDRKKDASETGHVLYGRDFPRYFEAMNTYRVISASEARHDPRTREFLDPYLVPNELHSLLDGRVLGANVTGVVCAENREPRIWSFEEQNYVASIAELVATACAIQAAREAENKFSKKDLHYQLLVQNTYDLIVLINADGSMGFISDNIEQMTGYTAEEYRKFGSFSNMHPDDVPIVTSLFDDLLSGQDRGVAEYRIKRKDGSYIWVQTRSAVIRDANGKLESILTNSNDITESKKSQAAMRELLTKTTQQNNRLKDFSYITSHGFRASVSNLIGLTELIEREPEKREYLEMIRYTAKHLDATIKNINSLLSFEYELDEQERSICNVSALITSLMELFAADIISRGLEIQNQVDPQLEIRAIPDYLESIFRNLISNAIKYGCGLDSKIIEVRGIKEDGLAVITVKDYGAGIDLGAYQDRIFELGGRFHGSSDGQGLGLFMTKHQVEAMDGTIRVESAVNCGATFVMTFPLASETSD